MIFYFTGTGNSCFAARKLADEGEKIVSIVDALRSKAFHYIDTLQDYIPGMLKTRISFMRHFIKGPIGKKKCPLI